MMAGMAGMMFGNPNILGWSCEQVAEWLRGLDDVILPYAHFFMNHGVNGRKLLTLVPNDLEKIGITKLGHQELILEAIDLLCALHYTLESENLQSISLIVSCRSRSLYNELKDIRSNPVYHKRHSVKILSAVNYVLQSSKNMLAWMQKSPFDSGNEYPLVKESIMKLSTEIIAAAQSDNRINESEEKLMDASYKLSELCENLVRNACDPLVIQPATLHIANLRKKPTEELGIHIHSTYDGIHVISAINNQSPAHVSGKIEEGDEVIQVNYQTVVGWQHKKLVTLMRENLKEVVLTLKRRPHHVSGNRHKKKKNNLSVIQTFPKAHKRRSGTDQNGSSSVPAFISALAPPEQEDVREVDTDNEVFRSGSESPHSLNETKDTKHRRATVSGVSPTLERASMNDSDQTSPETEKDNFDARLQETIVGTLSITSETHVQKPYPVTHQADVPQARQQLKFGGVPTKMMKNQEPMLLHMSSLDSTEEKKDKSSNTEKDAKHATDSVDSEGSYTVTIVGGIPQKVPIRDTVDGVQIRQGKKQKATRKVDRRISCKDLGQGDCQGWLEKKKYSRGIMQSKWIKRWFVLKSKVLFYYRDKSDLKADGIISLPGYQVSQAPEIKRKKYAFKLHHSGTTFYFASDRLDDMSKWMNKMALCSINYEIAEGSTASPFTNPGSITTIEEQDTPYHSESDEESEESRSDSSSFSSSQSLTDEQASRKENIGLLTPNVGSVTLRHPGKNPDVVYMYPKECALQTPDAKILSSESGFQTPDALCRMLGEKDLTFDGKNLATRRRTIIESCMMRPVEVDQIIKLQSLERTLKDKESDLTVIEGLLHGSEKITAEMLNDFKRDNPHLCSDKYSWHI